jgi:HAD superfamily hydrolase (TIGR01509 family)
MVDASAIIFPDIASFEAVIFDCDGTLVDTMPLFYFAWLDSLERLGSKYDFKWQFFCDHGGQSTEVTLEEICRLTGENIEVSTLKQYQAEFIQPRIGHVKPVMPVVQLAEQCHNMSKPMAVASAGYRKYVHESLESIGVKTYFPVVVTCEDVRYTKPAPDLFLLAAEKLGAQPRRCFVLEDSLLGIQAASAAGMASYLLPKILRPGAPNKC